MTGEEEYVNIPILPVTTLSMFTQEYMVQMFQGFRISQHAQAQSQAGSFAKQNNEFGELGGHFFIGKVDQVDGYCWLHSYEKILKKMKLEEPIMSELTAHRIEDLDQFWRDSIRGASSIEVSWKIFKEKFEANFSPHSARAKMVREFENLRQTGDMTI